MMTGALQAPSLLRVGGGMRSRGPRQGECRAIDRPAWGRFTGGRVSMSPPVYARLVKSPDDQRPSRRPRSSEREALAAGGEELSLEDAGRRQERRRRGGKPMREHEPFHECIEVDECVTDFDLADVGAERHKSVIAETWERGRWLLGLLVLQSSSSVVLERYEELIQDHIVVTLFLTMLVGAGGNAGNQSAISVIRGLATGELELSFPSFKRVLGQQMQVAALLGSALTLCGFLRVYLTNGELINAVAIAMALFCIVVTSVVMGTVLPFALAWGGTDPANAGTSIQVLMDILGVTLTCLICKAILDGGMMLPGFS